MSIRKEYLIVDGYNVIFAWPELEKLKDNLEHARLELQRLLQNYSRYSGFEETILVFDGRKDSFDANEERITKDFLIVYTGDETADAYIERMVHQKKERFSEIKVVTSDGAEQYQVLGSGGLRVSVRELRSDIQKMKHDERTYYNTVDLTIMPNDVASRIQNEDVAKKLEAMRLNKKV